MDLTNIINKWDGSGGVWRGLEGSGGVWRGLEGSGGVWRGLEGSGASPPYTVIYFFRSL